jgi:hypothetical protein
MVSTSSLLPLQGDGTTFPHFLHFAFWHVLSVSPFPPSNFNSMFSREISEHGEFFLQLNLMASLEVVVPLMFLKLMLLISTADS